MEKHAREDICHCNRNMSDRPERHETQVSRLVYWASTKEIVSGRALANIRIAIARIYLCMYCADGTPLLEITSDKCWEWSHEQLRECVEKRYVR
ncbi:MAG: hypothetical protein V1857_02075 [archaeon]